MPSFDIVSQVNSMEIENAVNIAKKELANRFDFRGTKAEIVLEKNEIKLSAENPFKLKALTEIVIGKIAKRNISLKNVEQCEPDVSPLGHARQLIKIKQGLDDRGGQTGHRLYPRVKVQSDHADSGPAGPRDRQEPGRSAGGDRSRAGEGLPGGAPVHELPRLGFPRSKRMSGSQTHSHRRRTEFWSQSLWCLVQRRAPAGTRKLAGGFRATNGSQTGAEESWPGGHHPAEGRARRQDGDGG